MQAPTASAAALRVASVTAAYRCIIFSVFHPPSYLRGMSRWFYSEFGYSMRDCFHGGFAGSLLPETVVFTLQPGWAEVRIHAHRSRPQATSQASTPSD